MLGAKTVLLSTVLFTNIAFAIQPKVIYGEDNRVEPYESNAWYQHSRSVAVQVLKRNIPKQTPAGYAINQTTLQALNSSCEGEKFIDQPVIGNCSGALIAPDMILTAGHCMETQADCDNAVWAFGYEVEREGVNPKELLRSNVYQCKKIIHQSYSPMGGSPDFAIIKLDRKTDREPLEILDQNSELTVGNPLVLLGYPSGIPLKIADGAKVLKAEKFEFVTDLDAFHGNSGSPVLDEKSGVIVGVLVSGRDDYKRRGSCTVVNTLPSTMGGERITSTKVIPRNF